MPVNIRLIAVWVLLFAVTAPARQSGLGTPTQVADGVLLYRVNDASLMDPAAPVSVQALRLDPAKVALEIGLAKGQPARETVEVIATRRQGTVAAINAGFFSMETGRPTDFLKVHGKTISGTARPRGAVGILPRAGKTTLLFDRLVVAGRRQAHGHAISGPGREAVGEPGGQPADYRPQLGSSPRDWAAAPFGISGAGLLLLNGRELNDYRKEQFADGFDTTRHPRTIIGTDADGAIWLVTVDGRQPELSVGMSFTDLQRLSRRLGLRSVLNLDGGGSTTMWIDGKVVNSPSDPDGPRTVSDAILVIPR